MLSRSVFRSSLPRCLPNARHFSQTAPPSASLNPYERALPLMFGLNQTRIDRVQAFNLLQTAYILGIPFATSLLGSCYAHGSGTKQNIQNAINLWFTSKNDVYSKNSLALRYLSGIGLPKIEDAAR